MRIAIFGGSFNPIHNGHIAIAEAVIKQNLCDEVWFLVTPQNPWKENDDLMDEELRLELCQLATLQKEKIKVSDFEFSLPRPSYSYQTLRALRKAYPEHSFTLLIGADNWAHFGKWSHPSEILTNHPVIVYPREGYDISVPPELPDCVEPQVSLLHLPLFNVSSTEIRDILEHDGDVSTLVPEVIIPKLKTTLTNKYKLNEEF